MDLKKVCCLCAMLAVSPVFAKGGAAWQNNPVVAMLRDGGSLGKAQAIDPHPLLPQTGIRIASIPTLCVWMIRQSASTLLSEKSNTAAKILPACAIKRQVMHVS